MFEVLISSLEIPQNWGPIDVLHYFYIFVFRFPELKVDWFAGCRWTCARTRPLLLSL